MFENYNYSESFIHKALPSVIEWSFYTLIARFIYLRLKEVIKRQKESKQKINKIRTTIAYEMHQDIGNDLNALLYKIKYWHLKNGSIESQEYLQLERSTVQVIDKVNDIVWSLNAEKNNLKALQNHLIAYAEETISYSNMTCLIESVNNMPSKAIELEIKKNIYLLYKEAINNVVKHANASQVSIQFKYKFKKLKITIADDGKGFDLNKVIKGNGLDSMQNRIKQVNGKIEFIPNQPQGTIVIFELKI